MNLLTKVFKDFKIPLENKRLRNIMMFSLITKSITLQIQVQPL